MPAGPAARASSATSSERTNGSSWVAAIGEDLERQRVQRIAGEDRGAFVEGAVHGRLAAAQIVIVHARQIVVDQRIDMDAFDREAGAQRAVAIDVEQVARRR